jgi:hypothetical protein
MADTANMCCDVYVALHSEGCDDVNAARIDALQKSMESLGVCSSNSSACYTFCPEGQYYQSGVCKQ